MPDLDLEGLVARASEARDAMVACAEEINNFLMPLKDKGPLLSLHARRCRSRERLFRYRWPSWTESYFILIML